jgi:hypothetical protein
MKRLALAFLLIAATGAQAHGFDNDGADCSSRNFRFGDGRSVVAEEKIDGRGLSSIRATVTNGPIAVIGDSNSGYSIEVCKAASTAEDLANIRVSLNGNELRADGPAGGRWTVAYRVHVPRNADVTVDAKNGPVSFRDVDGRVVARSANGPLSLDRVTGDVDATAKNGPISVNGGSGNMKVQATNGPLSIQLDGNAWEGGSLDAATQNGPLDLRLPRNYNSGVVVETSGRGPFSCRAEGCSQWRAERRRSSDDDYDAHDRPQRLELGNGRTDVRISTVNGPVTIKDE